MVVSLFTDRTNYFQIFQIRNFKINIEFSNLIFLCVIFVKQFEIFGIKTNKKPAMSESGNTENCLQLVLENSEELLMDENEIIYPDGTRAVLVNWNLFEADDTVILQEEDMGHLYVEGDNDQILLADGQDFPNEENIDSSKIIELVDVDTDSDLMGEEPQILYIAENGLITQDDSISQFELTGKIDDDELVETQIIDLEEFMKESDESVFECLEDTTGFQYAVLRDGKLHLPSFNGEFIPTLSSEDSQEASCSTANNDQAVDMSSITGKNLITGQKVTLDKYMDKIQKQLKKGITPSSNTSKRKLKTNDLYNLLNKKLEIGRTTEGKKLVGKIVQVKRKISSNEDVPAHNTIVSLKQEKETPILKTEDDPLINNDTQMKEKEDSLSELQENEDGVKLYPKDHFQPISKTLEGLMLVDNVRKKLENKNIVIRIIEKPTSSEKHVSFISGRMKKDINSDGNATKNWSFITDNKTQSYFEFSSQTKTSDVAMVTMIITYQKKNERIIRVILNPSTTKYACSKCARIFSSRLQLRIHRNSVHKIVSGKINNLKALENSLPSPGITEEANVLGESTNEVKKKYQCGFCVENFASNSLLNTHLKLIHKLSKYPYSCETCGQNFLSIGDLNHHKKEHVSVIKYYQCDTCKRTFTRYSNLQRHLAIHQGAEQMFQCSLCGCSYHYPSSLTKHIVQNHIQTDLKSTK